MIKKILLFLLLFPAICLAQYPGGGSPSPRWVEFDGSPDLRPRTIIISNDTAQLSSDGVSLVYAPLNGYSGGGGGVTSVTEGVASPLIITPTTGAVIVDILSADDTTAGYITAANHLKITTASSDVGDLKVKVNIISSDSAIQDTKLGIISADVGTLKTNDGTKTTQITILSNDAVIQDEKITIISNDVGQVKTLSINILSPDVQTLKTKTTIISNDLATLVVSKGGTGKSSWTQYLIPYTDTTTSFSQIAIGNAGQVLTSNGAGAAPTFQAGGDITSVGDVSSGAAFDGTQGTTLTFDNAGGDATIAYDGSTFTFSKFITGNVTGNLTGNASGTAATVTGAAQANITSLGTLTTLTVDDITINGNAISSAGASSLTITPTAGQNITLDGAVTIDAGVVGGITTLDGTNLHATTLLTDHLGEHTGAHTIVFDNTATLGTLLGTIDAGGATSFELPNGANPTCDASGEIAINTTDKTLELYNGANQVAFPTIHIAQGTFDLKAQYAVDPDLWLIDLHADSYPHGIYITKIYVDASVADPTTELNANLNYCDATTAAFPGANPTLIKAIDTTTGNFADAAVNTAVPTGKSIYITMDADPTDATTQYHIRIHYYIPTA